MLRLKFFIFLLGLLSVCLAANPTSFCKCTCGTFKEIIALDAPSNSRRSLFSLSGRADDKEKEKGDKGYKAKTCNDCNRQFCLDYNLPKCKEVDSSEIYTQCFQRDSTKDQAIVFIFIIATVSLLMWALVRPWAGSWLERAKERRSYIPVGEGEN